MIAMQAVGAGVVAVGVALAIGSRVSVTRAPAALATPGAVLRHPDPARPLAERWDWGRAEAQRLGGRGVWIGYHVRSSLLVDLSGLASPGARLAQLVGKGEGSDALALLFRYTPGGRPLLARVVASSFLQPVDLGGEALVWLGAAEDLPSLARLQTLFAEAPTLDLKEHVVAAVGLHGSTAAVVPLLDRWSARAEPPSVRARAAVWLRHHGRAPWSAPASSGDGRRKAGRLIATAEGQPYLDRNGSVVTTRSSDG